MKPSQAQHLDALRAHLDRHTALLGTRAIELPELIPAGTVVDREHQKQAAAEATMSQSMWCGELATGSGKTIVAALIAERYLPRRFGSTDAKVKRGNVLYVCPSAAAIGDRNEGITEKFDRVFRHLGVRGASLGDLNEVSAANDVSFVTPHRLAKLWKTDTAFLTRFLGRTGLMIVDEAHHFPECEDLTVYNVVAATAKGLASKGRKVVTLTGTHERHDGRAPMGKMAAHFTFTTQEAVDTGVCPELYGIQVLVEVVGSVRSSGDMYDFHLSKPEREKYLDGVAGCMAEVHSRYPVPTAAFVRTVKDAEAISALFRDRTQRTLEILTSDVPIGTRKQIVSDIRAGRLAGYVTCSVGEESLDIPEIEIVHLVRRTRSFVRNAQAIGRAMRPAPNKRRALIIDYQTVLDDVVSRLHDRKKLIGIGLPEYAGSCDTRIKRPRNGGPLVARGAFDEGDAILGDVSIEDERALILGKPTERQIDEAEDAQRRKRLSFEKKMSDLWEQIRIAWPERAGQHFFVIDWLSGADGYDFWPKDTFETRFKHLGGYRDVSGPIRANWGPLPGALEDTARILWTVKDDPGLCAAVRIAACLQDERRGPRVFFSNESTWDRRLVSEILDAATWRLREAGHDYPWHPNARSRLPPQRLDALRLVRLLQPAKDTRRESPFPFRDDVFDIISVVHLFSCFDEGTFIRVLPKQDAADDSPAPEGPARQEAAA